MTDAEVAELLERLLQQVNQTLEEMEDEPNERMQVRRMRQSGKGKRVVL